MALPQTRIIWVKPHDGLHTNESIRLALTVSRLFGTLFHFCQGHDNKIIKAESGAVANNVARWPRWNG